MQTAIVISDEFERFAEKPSLLRYTALLNALKRGDLSTLRGRRFIAGQGLDEMQIDHAYCLALSEGLDAEFASWRLWRHTTIADQAICHKHRAENVLISAPERVSEELFVAELLIHARNELMLDHLTGEHVQGMVLAEACRQMFLAVTELYCLQNFSAKNRYFVINEMSIRYLAFAFPLPGQIRYKLLNMEQPKPDRLTVHADMEIWQCDRPVTGMTVKFAVFDAKSLSERETRLAQEAVHLHLSQTEESALEPA